MAMFCGAEGNKFIFTNDNKLVFPWFPKSLSLVLFAEFFENSSRKLSTPRRRFQYNSLKHEVLKQYIPVIDQTAREHIEKEWAPNQEVKVLPPMKKYTFSLACFIFMNIAEAEKIKKLADPFDIVSKGLRLSLPINLPGFAFKGAIKAAKVVREQLVKIMRERKEELMKNKGKEVQPDSLTQMLLYTDEDGQFMSEIEIGINIMGLLLAKYESTSNHGSPYLERRGSV
nr:beta-amyrin 28-monooxygenase-like [Coffea arabica]